MSDFWTPMSSKVLHGKFASLIVYREPLENAKLSIANRFRGFAMYWDKLVSLHKDLHPRNHSGMRETTCNCISAASFNRSSMFHWNHSVSFEAKCMCFEMLVVAAVIVKSAMILQTDLLFAAQLCDTVMHIRRSWNLKEYPILELLHLYRIDESFFESKKNEFTTILAIRQLDRFHDMQIMYTNTRNIVLNVEAYYIVAKWMYENADSDKNRAAGHLALYALRAAIASSENKTRLCLYYSKKGISKKYSAESPFQIKCCALSLVYEQETDVTKEERRLFLKSLSKEAKDFHLDLLTTVDKITLN